MAKRTIDTGRKDTLGRPIKVAPPNDHVMDNKVQGILNESHNDTTPYFSDIQDREVIHGDIVGEHEMYSVFTEDGMRTAVSTASLDMFNNFIDEERANGNDIPHGEGSYENFQNNNFRIIRDFMQDEFGIDNLRFNTYDMESMNEIPAEDLDDSQTCQQLHDEHIPDNLNNLMGQNIGGRFSSWARKNNRLKEIVVL